MQRFGVTTTVFVDAADADEGALLVERDLAGRMDPIIHFEMPAEDSERVRRLYENAFG